MFDWDARSESTFRKLLCSNYLAEGLRTFHIPILILDQDAFVVFWQLTKETKDSTGLSLVGQPNPVQNIKDVRHLI